MKLRDLEPLNESIINVPKHWIKDVVSLYLQPAKYAFMMEFSDNDEEAEEVSIDIQYQPNDVYKDRDVYKNRNKLTVLKSKLPLEDKFDETFIETTHVMVVAKFDPDSSGSPASYASHPKYGNMIIVNVAYPLSDASKSLDDVKAMHEVERTLNELVEHELVHLIQHVKGDVRQLKMNKDYYRRSVSDKKEYHKSPIEFNALITSFIREMERKIDELTPQQQSTMGYDNLLNGVKYAVGDINKKYKHTGKKNIDTKMEMLFSNMFTPSEFLLDLKNEKPNQWKKAVTSIIDHFEKYLEA